MTQEELNMIIEDHQHWLARDCEGWESMRANLSGADLSGLSMENARMSYGTFNRANLSGTNLNGADMSLASMAGVNLSRTQLYGTNMCGAYMIGANLDMASLKKVNMREANLNTASMKKCRVSETILYRASLQAACMDGSVFKNCKMCGADLSNTSLFHTRIVDSALQNVKLICARFGDVDLSNSNMSWTDMGAADVSGACLKNVDLTRAHMDWAFVSGNILDVYSLSEAFISGLVITAGDHVLEEKIQKAVSCLSRWKTYIINDDGWAACQTEKATKGYFPYHVSYYTEQVEELVEMAALYSMIIFYDTERMLLIGGDACRDAVKAGVLNEGFKSLSKCRNGDVMLLKCKEEGISRKEANELAVKFAAGIAGYRKEHSS